MYYQINVGPHIMHHLKHTLSGVQQYRTNQFNYNLRSPALMVADHKVLNLHIVLAQLVYLWRVDT